MDVISRQDAIDALMEIMDRPNHADFLYTDEICKTLNELPSAQQEIVRCKECKHHWTHRCMDSMPTEICDLNQTFYDPNIDFCSLAERRTDGKN